MRTLSVLALAAAAVIACFVPTTARAAERRNILFILIDDMRYDVMGCAGHPIVKTPNLDRLAAGGVRFTNAFVTTSLCSPSRATILTGTYAHKHGVMNNRTRLDPALPTFPQELKRAGYQTAFVGKWHMGNESDGPQPGFDHWASFRGQGNYLKNRFNINGERKDIEGYVTDLITDMSADWLKSTAKSGKPFMMYVSHKAVHAEFTTAERHNDLYADANITLPPSSLDTPENYFRRPRWVREQRDSWHGINDAYFKQFMVTDFIRQYYRTLQAVDDSVGRLLDTLKELGILDSTLVIFTSDNGFQFGEHGLIDKRCMYEDSIRVPVLMSCPQLFKGGQVSDRMVLNIDLAPTMVEAAGLAIPPQMQGESFLKLASDPKADWRKSFLYEYFWEPDFPETPSVLGVRTEQYAFMEYQGIWDTNELYDLEKDPKEMHNHISTSRRKAVTVDPEYKEVYKQMQAELRALTEKYGALDLPSWKKN